MTEPKTKKCEMCGAIKPLADFSKSYKNRCKSCVAAEMRMHRASEAEEVNRIKPKIKECAHRIGSRVEVFKKAQIKLTGEVVEVVPCESVECSVPAFKTIDGRIIPQTFLLFTPEIDWEQRRYELTKAALQGLLANQMWMQFRIPYSANADECIKHLTPQIPKDAIAIADAVILELKSTPKL